ncbi:hypothetical protein DFH06DRAFT_1146966 [Mycena polygramma]|nr:hypothetical protein DFH06DRAFT_1146966 [Mycena polygramma]
MYFVWTRSSAASGVSPLYGALSVQGHSYDLFPRTVWAGAGDGEVVRRSSGTAMGDPGVCGGFLGEARKHYALALGAVATGFWRALGAGTGSFTAGELKRAGSSASSFGTSSFSVSAPSTSYTDGASFSGSAYHGAHGAAGEGGARGARAAGEGAEGDFVVVAKDEIEDEIEVSSVYSAAGYWSADGHGNACDYAAPSPSSSPPHSTSTSAAYAASVPASSAAQATSTHSSASAPHPAHVDLELDPRLPALPPSFAHTNRTSASTASALPPHVGWAEQAYPASPLSSSFAHTASSFARISTGTRTSTGTASALSPHVAWAEQAYPASPRSVAHPYAEEEHEDEEWSPASDAHSISMGEMQQGRVEMQGRAGREIV